MKSQILILSILTIIFVTLIYTKIYNHRTSKENNLRLLSQNVDNTYKYIYKINNFDIIYKDLSQYEFAFISNYDEKKTSDDIILNNACKILFNGGFYSKDNKPLGYLFYQNNIHSNFLESELFNGLITRNNNQWMLFDLESFNKSNEYNFAMQTGPILVKKGVVYEQFDNSNNARRIVLALDNKGSPSVLVIYNSDNLNSGPNLNEVKDILFKLINENKFQIYDAINLDGGHASLYIDDNYILKESTFSGSFFCFK